MSSMNPIRTTPGQTKNGKAIDRLVLEREARGELRLERIPAATLGTPLDLEVYRAKRKRGSLIVDWVDKSGDQYCSANWSDLRIGSGACGYRCARCFLILTHRVKADPSRHILYDNVDDYAVATKAWLVAPHDKRALGLGIDCSDSLLYEGVVGHARRLIPLFADAATNPQRRKLLLLTKSANTRYLEGLPSANVVVSFSLNPERMADMFEGRYPNGGPRVTPPISERLRASEAARRMGFETRWRIDPILPAEGWEDTYREFFSTNARACGPARNTLGLYREMGAGLDTFARLWGLPEFGWRNPYPMAKDHGVHRQLPRDLRIAVYAKIRAMIEAAWPPSERPMIALCKEVRAVRLGSGVSCLQCNCLP